MKIHSDVDQRSLRLYSCLAGRSLRYLFATFREWKKKGKETTKGGNEEIEQNLLNLIFSCFFQVLELFYAQEEGGRGNRTMSVIFFSL